MRYRGSITGPLVLITVGCLFLAHTFSPGFDVISAVSHYWPFLLIGWGVIGLLEVLFRSFGRGTVPMNGVSGGGWLVILLVIFAGYASRQWNDAGAWWHRAGMDIALLGDAHDFSFDLIRKPTGSAPRVVIESFRGDAKITGTDVSEVTVSGHKTVRAFDMAAAEKVNAASGVEAIVEGNTVVIRCRQDHLGHSHTQVTANLVITVPRGAVLEAVGQRGDFDVSSIRSVDISSDNAGVKVRDIAGEVKIDTRLSDDVTASNVAGAVTLRGHGEDVNLTSVKGQVSVEGDYTGTIVMRAIASPVRIESMHTQFDAQAVPGMLTLERGSLDGSNLVGPLKVTAQSTDVSLKGFQAALDLTVDKGDVDLKPENLPLSDIAVKAHSGDVSLVLPPQAAFDLNAATAHGAINNDYGDALTAASVSGGSTLTGKIGEGPQIAITADHGDISIGKAGAAHPKAADGEKPPSAPRSENGSEI